MVYATPLPVPACPDDDQRYLRIFRQTGWKLAFHTPGEPNRICWTSVGWDPDDPQKTLLEWFRAASIEALNHNRECLSRFRYVAVG